ncbi:tRNA-splicing endonuclease positive effector (SEN1) (ISS) [Aphelenchoides avenae]|nr:tRNA-splicing endonuclease positive effector (SEN1) (ISS) [Aphelenchus avenae]
MAGLQAFKAFGLRSMADIMADRAIAKHCQLNEAYRPHPLIFEAWNRAVYEGSVQCKVRAEDRAFVTSSTFPLPKKGVPILLIHDRADLTKGPAKSLSNETHEKMAFKLIGRLHASVPKLRVTVICHYADTRSKVKELMRTYDKRNQVMVTTIDAYEGQEQEAIIVITTRTSGSSNFVVDEKRTASAITRPRDFVAVIGDLEYLRAGELWSRYLLASVSLAPPVDASYVDLVCQKDFVAQYSDTGRLLDKEGKPVTSSSMLAVQWVEAATPQTASGSKSS